MQPEPIHDIAHLGHVELLTPKFEESRRFFIDIMGMTQSGEKDGSVYLRKGKLIFSDTRVSGQTGTVEAEAEVANPDGVLKPGQFIRVRLLGATRPGAIEVPTRAVLEGPQGKFVYVMAGGKALPRPVEVGDQVGDNWIVTKGLATGDDVIVDGMARIFFPGAPVRLAQAAPAGPR